MALDKSMNGSANGHVVATKPRRATRVRAKQGRVGWLTSQAIRILTWYSIVTILFRCPSNESLLDSSSPKICKPYLQVRSFVTPHLTPYYDTYAAPYVEKARPYYAIADDKVIAPALKYGKKYGAPKLTKAQAYGQAQWDKTIHPELMKLNNLAQKQYSHTVGPYATQASAVVSPYYSTARDNAIKTYNSVLLPAYVAVQPYALNTYSTASDFAIDTGYPYAKWIWTTGIVFIDRTIWPKVRILYGENVEPQLVRIGERLGRYRDGKRLKAAVDEFSPPASKSIETETSSGILSSISEAAVQMTERLVPTSSATTETTVYSTASTSTIVEPETITATSEEAAKKAKDVVDEDLANWQAKFTKAADQGSKELNERVAEITERAVQKQAAGLGEAHVVELEETVKSAIGHLKSQIISVVKSESTTAQAPEEEIASAVRTAGAAIKDKAQAVRLWRQKSDQETNSLVSKAVDDTLEIIDHIRDLGFQEIGMRWAWTDGITHKDWQRYHSLKSGFEESRHEVEDVAVKHPGLARARTATEDIEHRAMVIAEDAVKELTRVKDTGRWKLSTKDISDDWTTKYMPAAAVVAGGSVAQKIVDAKEAIVGKPVEAQGTMESLTSVVYSSLADASTAANSIVSSLSNQVSSSIVGTQQGTIASAGSVASSQASSAAEALASSASSLVDVASSSVLGTQTGTIESLSSAAAHLADQASSTLIGSQQGSIQSMASVVSSQVSGASETVVSSASSVIDQVSSSVLGSSQGYLESLSSAGSASTSSASGVVSNTISAASATLTSLVDRASVSLDSATASVVSVASELSSGASNKISEVLDNAASLTSSMKSSSSALSNAASSSASSLSSSISSSTSSLSAAASSSVSIASSVLSKSASGSSLDLTSTAAEATESVKSVWGGAMAQAVKERQIVYDEVDVEDEDPMSTETSPTSMSTETSPTSMSTETSLTTPQSALTDVYSDKVQSMAGEAGTRFADITNAVSEALLKSGAPTPTGSIASMTSVASEQYAAAIAAASIALYGTPEPTGVYASISALAASRLSEGLSLASAQYSSVKSNYGPTPTPAAQKYLSQAQAQYYAGVGMAYDRYSQFLSSASSAASAVMPTTTPAYQSLLSKASASVMGTAPGRFESLMSIAQKQLYSANSAASSNLDVIMASITGGTNKAMPTAHMVSLASSRYNAALTLASEKFASASSAASVAAYGSSTGVVESLTSQIVAGTDAITSAVVDNAQAAASQVVDGTEALTSAVADNAQSAASQVAEGAGVVSSAVVENAQAAISLASENAEALSSVASENWEALITKVSIQIYGEPTPVLESLWSEAGGYASHATSQAGEYGAQVTQAAAAQYVALQSLFSELVSGREPDFTESVYARFSSAYYTGTPEIVSSIASAASEGYASASSMVVSVMTPPAVVETAMSRASEGMDDMASSVSSVVSTVSKSAESLVSSASSVISSATAAVKDEL